MCVQTCFVLLSLLLIGCSSAQPLGRRGGGRRICPFELLHSAWEETNLATQVLLRCIMGEMLQIPYIAYGSDGQNEKNPAPSCSWIQNRNPQVTSSYYWVRSFNGTAVQLYCDMSRQCGNATGGWARIGFLNMSDPTHHCPPAWREITSLVRTCGSRRLTGSIHTHRPGCNSVVFNTHGMKYTKVTGRVIGYQYASPDGFRPYSYPSHPVRRTLDEPYLDGVSITHGTPQQHVWSFAAAHSEQVQRSLIGTTFSCPCVNTTADAIGLVPPFIGNNYFCEAGYVRWPWSWGFNSADPLWDGDGCGPTSHCCTWNNPPWFCRQLSESTTDNIEVRICGDYSTENEDTPIQLLEIYVQ